MKKKVVFNIKDCPVVSHHVAAPSSCPYFLHLVPAAHQNPLTEAIEGMCDESKRRGAESMVSSGREGSSCHGDDDRERLVETGLRDCWCVREMEGSSV